jgi:hypothetical protein
MLFHQFIPSTIVFNLHDLMILMQTIPLTQGIDYGIFGIGTIVFVILSTWLRLLYKEKNEAVAYSKELEKRIIDIVEKLNESEKTSIALLGDFNSMVLSIQRDIQDSNANNNITYSTKNSELLVVLQRLEFIINQMANQRSHRNDN